MTTAAKTNRASLRTSPTWTRRALQEWSATGGGRIDRDKKVIYGVKVLGRYSRNSHGLKEAENGTEYTRKCMEDALPLYEGCEVLADHAGGSKPRGVADVLGVLRKVRVEDDGIHADLHYYESHPLTPRLLEDAEKGSDGVLGLSHDAEAGRERFDRANRRLVIESLKSVKSVDLVRKPATNRNLFEGQAMETTLRKLLEALKLTPTRQAWRKRLLEDDAMAPPMDAPVEAPATDPDQALTDGFKAAIMACVDDDTMDAAAKIAKIKTLLTTHEKLTQAAEPEAPVKEEDGSSGDDSTSKTDDKKTEAEKENAVLKHKLKVRELVEASGVKADKVLLESLESVPEATARKLLEREKARGPGVRSPGHPKGTGSGDDKPAANSGEFASRIKG